MTDITEIRTAYHHHESALLPQLLLCRLIYEQPRQHRAQTIADALGISRETVKRMLTDLRNMGADVYYLQSGQKRGYVLGNGDRIMPRLDRWIDLERTRDLTGEA